MKTLYYGNNLMILRDHIASESVDLIYLDPPFQSGKNYNLLFQEQDGSKSKAQIQAFEDTWHYDNESEKTYLEIRRTCNSKVVKTIDGFQGMLGTSDMMAYLVMMTIRLVELHRVLKSSGSLYLHCDPTASHYLKIVLDSVFDAKNFRNEIVWFYKDPSGKTIRFFRRKHDVLLFYSKSEDYTFNVDAIRIPYSEGTQKQIDNGVISFGRISKGNPLGKVQEDVWDISIINSQAKERLGYPTQKPKALLERIIKASSNENDIVLDPFCGCGTTIAAAQELKRNWIGIDITHLAIGLIKRRLKKAFGEDVKYKIVGEPTDTESAHILWEQNPYQFQCWAVNLIEGCPTKPGGDKGIDGYKYFEDPKAQQMIISVKGGNITPSYIRDLKGVVNREKAALGIFISFEEATREMHKEAAATGFYESDLGSKHPKIQLLTIKELIEGKKIDYPRGAIDKTFKNAKRAKMNKEIQEEF
jgi:site-specific DNA-methyltransferase (adenine-specific)